MPAENGVDVYETEARDGRLLVRGSSGVAMCRGFYDYRKNHDLGIVSWTGSRLAGPDKWPDSPKLRVVSPCRHRFYFNVVTYG